ncbi:carbohydrate ABC transporter permease [Alloscardovia omnicolens]|uniref:carbohydrate ABC transporter permease n=1 Tax=Alloscardovia omnicolens TaxID=419015 RepID=UPI003A692AD6
MSSSQVAATKHQGRDNQRSNRKVSMRRTMTGLAFTAPALLVLMVFVFYPTIKTLLNSFTSTRINRPGKFVALDNYIKLFKSADFWLDVRNTVIYAVVYAPLVVVVALLLALLLTRKDIRGVGFFRSVMFFPFVISLTVASIAWSFLLSPSLGLVPYWIGQITGHYHIDLLGNKSTALAAIIFITVWKNFGYFMVIFIAGLQGISAELYEAASLDGANAWQKFWNITLPALRPTFNYIIIFGLIGSFQVFDQVFILTSGGPARSTETIVYRIYTEAFGNGKLGYASALSYVLLIMTLIIGVIQLVSNSKHEKEEIA